MKILLLLALLAIALVATILDQLKKAKKQGIHPFPQPPLIPPPQEPRYRKRQSLLSHAEAQFFRVLRSAVPEAPIFPKVRVADVLEAKKAYSGDFLRISQKHFDWVLCHPVSFEPLVAIELDDSSHRTSRKQMQNDRVKNECAQEAGMHLLRFRWQQYYNENEVRDRISKVVNQITPSPKPVQA